MVLRSIYLFVISVLLAGTLFVSGAQAAGDPPIVIATVFAHSGEAAAENSPNYPMTRLAVQVANENGGVLGRRIELLELDNKSTAIGSHQAALKAVEAGVVAVVGPSWSSHALAMAPVLQKAGIPMVGATTSAPEVTLVGEFIFRACYTNQTQASALARFAIEELQAFKAAFMVVAGDVYSEDMAKRFQTEYTKLGGEIVANEQYLLSAMDFKKQLEAVRDSKPALVFVPGFARDSGLILTQARDMGITVPFLGGDGWTALEDYPHIEQLVGDNFYTSHWHPESSFPKSREFMELVVQRLGPGALETIDAGNPVAYDAMSLVLDAIRRAGSADPAAIRDALSSTVDFRGVTGSISFQGTRDPRKDLVILRISGDSVHYVKTIQPQ